MGINCLLVFLTFLSSILSHFISLHFISLFRFHSNSTVLLHLKAMTANEKPTNFNLSRQHNILITIFFHRRFHVRDNVIIEASVTLTTLKDDTPAVVNPLTMEYFARSCQVTSNPTPATPFRLLRLSSPRPVVWHGSFTHANA